MNIWPLETLESLYAEPSRNGLTRPKKVRGSGYRMINMGEIFAHERIGDIEMERVQMTEKEIASFEVKRGDLLFARQSLVLAGAGKCALVKSVGETTTFESHLIRVRLNPKCAEPDFYFYYFISPQGKQNVQTIVMQVAAAGIRGSELAKLEVPVPPLPVQQRIAGILSAYDELIENSQRRIRILEKMAQSLYREWFVQYRFPGHEKVKMEGGIPKGWEVKTVADSFEISGGGTPSRKEAKYWEDGTIQWFSPSGLTGADTMFMDDSPEHITEVGLAESSARLFPAFSVMLTSRATIGAIAINTHEACTNQGFITCLPNERVPLYFLFHWLTENVPTFQRMASGATFKEISRGVFKTIEFLHPSTSIVRLFESRAEPMAKQMLALQRQIHNLRRTRNLLLPRLLSGNP